MPDPISLLDRMNEIAPRLAGGVALPAPEPWLRALALAIDEALDAIRADYRGEAERIWEYQNAVHARLAKTDAAFRKVALDFHQMRYGDDE